MSRMNQRKNSTYLVIGVGFLFLAIIVFQQIASSNGGYAQKIEEARAATDLWMTNSLESPIPQQDRPSFKGLDYYPVHASYAVSAQFVPLASPDTLLTVNSHDEPEQMVHIGDLQFRLQDQWYTLQGFKTLSPVGRSTQPADEVFVPFIDETSALTTYGGGRYLNVSITEPVMVDFNLAHHPYCAYNPDFVCPLPPAENVLAVAIEAGECLPGALDNLKEEK